MGDSVTRGAGQPVRHEEQPAHSLGDGGCDGIGYPAGTAGRYREDRAPANRCPYGRHFSYLTGEWSVQLDDAALAEIMDMVWEVWEHAEAGKDTGDQFQALIDHIAGVRRWTGEAW